MPRKLPLGLLVLCLVSLIAAACAGNTGNTGNLNIGPNFPKGTLYVANSNEDAIGIYGASEANGKGATYEIAGSSTDLVEPQYLAFDASNDLWVTDYSANTQSGYIDEIEALATGNVMPIGLIAGASDGVVHPRGIAINTTSNFVVIANTNPAAGASFENQLLVYSTEDARAGVTVPGLIIAGPATNMNVPSGVAMNGYTAYVSNLQGASVEAFLVPSPTPTVSPTATPTPSPSPLPTPSGQTPTPSPTPSPTPTPYNTPPALTLSGNLTGITQPSGLALDANGDLYVSDEGSLSVQPAILIFPASVVSLTGSQNVAPSCKLSGTNTKLFAPTDVAVGSTGNIYVADTTSTGVGEIYVYDGISTTCGTANVAPTSTYSTLGIPVGLGLIP
jgi:hypothetical protein